MTIKDAVDRIKSDLSEVGYTGERVKLVYKDDGRYLVFKLDSHPINRVEIEKRTLEWHVLLIGDFNDWWIKKFRIIRRRCRE